MFEIRSRESISALKSAIRQERSTLADYQERLASGRGNFPAAGLRHGIERCEHNIEVMRAAVLNQRAALREHQGQQKIQAHIDRILTGERVEISIDIDED